MELWQKTRRWAQLNRRGTTPPPYQYVPRLQNKNPESVPDSGSQTVRALHATGPAIIRTAKHVVNCERLRCAKETTETATPLQVRNAANLFNHYHGWGGIGAVTAVCKQLIRAQLPLDSRSSSDSDPSSSTSLSPLSSSSSSSSSVGSSSLSKDSSLRLRQNAKSNNSQVLHMIAKTETLLPQGPGLPYPGGWGMSATNGKDFARDRFIHGIHFRSCLLTQTFRIIAQFAGHPRAYSREPRHCHTFA